MEKEKDTYKSKEAIILVVDDEKDIQNFFRFKLQKIGYEVVVAQNGLEAIEKVKKFRPDLILMDIMMPVMDGLKATENLKKHKEFKNIPIIIVSAITDVKGKAAAYTFGADDYLTKPIDIITMAARVKSILETQKLRTQLDRIADRKAITDNLFDYQHLFERVETELIYCSKNEKPLSLIYIDIDYMKMINTENGYKAGDFVIRKIKEIVYNEINEVGIIIHSNSDKLLIILPRVYEDKVLMFVKQIINQIEQTAVPFDFTVKQNIMITGISISSGIVTWDKVEKVTSEKLLSLVETALKNAKDEGRGKNVQYQFYSKPLKNGTNLIDKKVIK